MKLICIKEQHTQGSILTIGSKYDSVITQNKYTIVTDNKKYWHYNSLIIESRHWIPKDINKRHYMKLYQVI
jgi:hypothetical protein